MAERPWIPHIITAHDLSLDKTSLGSIAKKFGVTPQQIAKANGVAWNTPAIDKWVLSVGGKRLRSGFTTFTVGNKILLPWPPSIPGPGDLDKQPEAPMASAVKVGGIPWWGWLGLAAGGIYLYKRRKKKKGGKKAEAKIVRF